MNSKNIAILGVIVLAILGGVIYTKNASTDTNDMSNSSELSMEKPTDTLMKKESRYVEFTQTAFDAAASKKRVYFFHASWCPTCKTANNELMGYPEGIPESVMLFKTDYDTNDALKKQYGITYQHTYVLVDDMGKEVKKWNGGGLKELVANTK